MVELVHVLVEEALKQRQHVPVLEVFDRDSGGAIHTVLGAELLAASAHVASILRATCPRIGPEDVCLIVVYPEETLSAAMSVGAADAWPLSSLGVYLLTLQLGVLRAGAAFLLTTRNGLSTARGGRFTGEGSVGDDVGDSSGDGLRWILREAAEVKATCVLVLKDDAVRLRALQRSGGECVLQAPGEECASSLARSSRSSAAAGSSRHHTLTQVDVC